MSPGDSPYPGKVTISFRHSPGIVSVT